MTEAKLILKTEVACEDLLYMLTKIDKLTEDGKLRLQNKLKEVQSEIRFKPILWED